MPSLPLDHVLPRDQVLELAHEPGAPAIEQVEGCSRERADPERAERLGASAREPLRSRHAWPALAGETLDLVDRVLETKADKRASAAR